MSNQNEKKIDDDEFIRNLDKSSILSGDESEDEEDQESSSNQESSHLDIVNMGETPGYDVK